MRQELLAYYPGPLPRSRLVLMDVDPSTIHAYWSIDPDYLAGLRRRHRTPAAPLALRLHELNGHGGVRRHSDFPLEGLTNNRNFMLWAEGCTYLGQIGLKTRRRFISVATSGPLRMPQIGPPPQPPPPQAAAQAPAQPPPGVVVQATAQAAAQAQATTHAPNPVAEGDKAWVGQLEAERETLIRSRYRELAERAAAGGPEGLDAAPIEATPVPRGEGEGLAAPWRQPPGGLAQARGARPASGKVATPVWPGRSSLDLIRGRR